MKAIFALLLLAFSMSATVAVAGMLSPLESFTRAFSSISSPATPLPEAKGRKGSKRIGGYTSKGKGSRYIGGRR